MVDQQDTIAFLSSGAAFPGLGAPVRHDTHAAIVFLSGTRAWKMKRAVRFAYLDFTTADQRRTMLERELALNNRTTSGLYLAVHPITVRDGTLAIDGAGAAVDWLLEMRRLPDDAMLDRIVAEDLDDGLARRIADQLASFHAGLAPIAIADPIEAVRRTIAGNRRCMEQYPAILNPSAVADIADESEAQLNRWSALVQTRAREGRVRHGHGDLHLGNIAVIDGIPTPFDCLEFDDAMATSDLLYDLAFLLMDLWRLRQHRQANLILNRYLDWSAHDEDGVALLPLFLSMRAGVRAHVEAAKSALPGTESSDRARAYLACSAAFLAPDRPGIVAIGGLSGTGKSTLARALAFRVGPAPGARTLSSDVLRKRLHGVPPEQRLPDFAYGAGTGVAVYGTMFALAAAAVRQGRSVILDATFASAADRRGMRELMQATGAASTCIWLRSATDLRIERVRGRRGDTSDVRVQVARQQVEPHDEELPGWSILSADQNADDLVREETRMKATSWTDIPGDVGRNSRP